MPTSVTINPATTGTLFVVPSGVTSLDVDILGEGENNNNCHRVQGKLAVTPGQILHCYRVDGAAGGAPSTFRGGAGITGSAALDIRTGGGTLAERVAVAGGHGGRAGSNEGFFIGSNAGGVAGHPEGRAGGGGNFGSGGGGPGTQTSGGDGGTAIQSLTGSGNRGTLSAGGRGGDCAYVTEEGGGGGGGGAGYYGGGGGAAAYRDFHDQTYPASGGGGGSSYAGGLTGAAFSYVNGVAPRIVITYVRTYAQAAGGALPLAGLRRSTFIWMRSTLKGVLHWTHPVLGLQPLAGKLTPAATLRRAHSGGFSFLGRLFNTPVKKFFASISSGSAPIVHHTTRFLAIGGQLGRGLLDFGSHRLGGTLQRDSFRTFLGNLSPIGTSIAARIYYRTLPGGLSFVGQPVKLVAMKLVDSSFGMNSALAFQAARVLTGRLLSTGSIVVRTAFGVTVTATLTSAGRALKFISNRASGTVTSASSQTRSVSMPKGGVIGPIGNCVILVAQKLTDSALGLVGAFERLRGSNLSGSITPIGDFTKRPVIRFDAAIVGAAGVTKRAMKVFLAGLTSFASLQRFTVRVNRFNSINIGGKTARESWFSKLGELTFFGFVEPISGKILGSIIAPVGTVVRSSARGLISELTFLGGITRSAGQRLFAGLAGAGALKRDAARALFSNLVQTGRVFKRGDRRLIGAVSFSGRIFYGFFLRLVSNLSFLGKVESFFQKPIHAVISFVERLIAYIKLTQSLSAELVVSENLIAQCFVQELRTNELILREQKVAEETMVVT